MIANLSGRTALVTGAGALHGMGATIAEVLAEQGARVAVADINLSGAEQVAKTLPGAFPVHLDVGSADSIESAVATVLAELGQLDILVNNAGIGGAAEGSGESDWDATFRVNLLGTVRCSEAVLAGMRERQYGKIVNIASISGHAGRRTNGPYSVSKAAVLRYTKGLAVDEAPHAINVNAVCPGAVWTGMQSVPFARPEDVDPALAGLSAYDAFIEYYRPITELAPPQTAREVGAAVAFLASEDARNITGQCLHVDGGAILE